MTVTGLEHAIQSLRLAVERPIRGLTWRALVRQRLDAVGEALHRESARRGGDAWLAAREHHLILERDRLLVRIADAGGNLVTVNHLREAVPLHVRETGVDLVLETRGEEHAAEILAALDDAGYEVERFDGSGRLEQGAT